MKKRFFTILCSLCLLSTLLTGCWQEEIDPADTSLLPVEEEPAEPAEPLVLPSELSLPFSAAQTLDPLTCPDGMQQVVGALMYEGLFTLDRELVPQQTLCSGYSYDPATLTYTFSIRDGVTFSDGSPLTAADAAATLNRAKTSQRYGSRLAQARTISAVTGAVRIVLTQANTSFPSLLDIPIVKVSAQTTLVPLGTGPYHYDLDENGPYLLANTHWRNSGNPPVERIRLVNAKDQDNMLYQFSSHNVQLITADLTGGEPVSVTGNISFEEADTTVLQYVGFNTLRPPFDSAAVRQAMAAGFNRWTVVSGFLSGHGTAAQFPVSPASPLYPAGLDATYSYSAFQSAMTAAGYNSGKVRSVTLLVNEENTFKVAAATYIASVLSAFDIKVEVRSLPWAEYTGALSAGNFDLYYGEVKLTADWDVSRLIATGGPLNYGGYTDPLTDQLLAAYSAAADPAAAMERLCRQLQAQAPILPVCFKTTSVLSQAGVISGLSPTAANPFWNLSELQISLAPD